MPVILFSSPLQKLPYSLEYNAPLKVTHALILRGEAEEQKNVFIHQLHEIY
jgi:hypothetical protein